MGNYFRRHNCVWQRCFFVVLLSLCLLDKGAAQTFNFKPSAASWILNASQIHSHGLPDTITVWCNDWDFITSNPSTWKTLMKLKSNSSFVKFSIDNFYPKSQNPFTYQLSYHIYGYYNDPNVDSISNTTYNDTLTISNFNHADPHNAYQDIQMAHYGSFYKTMVVIDQIYDITSGTPVPATLSDSTRWDFNVESSIVTQRYDKTYYGAGTSIEMTATPDPADNYLDVAFHLPGGPTPVQLTPVNFEMEWTYVDDYQRDPSSGTISAISAASLHYDFNHNNTRIWLDSSHYRIPLTYPRGYLVYRVRTVRPDSVLFQYPVYSDWSYSIADAGTVGSLSSGMYYISTPYSNDSLNWQYTVSFAEGGKYKHVVSFYDGLLKNRESITRFNSNLNKLIVTKNIYDFEGRPSIKTLPAPVNATSFSYLHNVDLNSVTGLPYQAFDFDTMPRTCPIQPQLSPLAYNALANIYYSNQNPDTAGVQQFVPDAGGYPMVETLFSPGFNDRVDQQGGAGPRLQLADSNVISNYYVSTQQPTLNSLFGLNAGWNNYYNMTVSRDPNEQLSMSIKDYEGKQVVSSLIGRGPSPLDHALVSVDCPDSSTFKQDILYEAPQEIIGQKRIADKTFFNEAEGNDTLQYIYTYFPYPVCPGQYLSVKAHYYYELSDICGDTLFSQDSTLGYDGVVSSPVSFSGSLGLVHMGQSEYTVHKELDISTTDIEATVNDYFNTPPNCLHDEPWFIRRSVEKQKFPCPPVDNNPCDALKLKMIHDLEPGGIYAGYKDSSGVIVGTGLSIFTGTISCEGCPPHYPYQDSCLKYSLPNTITISGITYTGLKTMPVDSFIMIYNLAVAAGNDSIAEALLPLHPEYCELKACIYDTFKTQLLAVPNAQVAQQVNLLYLDSMIAHDPITPMISGSGYDSLSTYPGGHLRLDYMELIKDYCGCNDSVMLKICMTDFFAYEINNRLLVNDYVKNNYFTDMQNLYLLNRQRFVDNIVTLAGTDSCAKCDSVRFPYTDGNTPFPITNSNGSPTSGFLDSIFASGDTSGALLLAGIADSSFSSDSAALADSALLIYTRGDSMLCYASVDSVVAALANCGSPALLSGIRSTLDSLCAAHAMPMGNYTPDIVRYAIVRNGGTINDLCNPYLVDFGFPSPPDPGTQGCLTDSFYSNVDDFLNDGPILNALVNIGTVYHDTLDYLHSTFENNMYLALGSSAPVIDYATYDVSHSLYTLFIVNDPLRTDTVKLYLRGTGGCSSIFSEIPGDSIIVNDVDCISSLGSPSKIGFINEFSFLATVTNYHIPTFTFTTCELLGWTDSLQTMADRSNTISGCVPCTQMRQLYTQFADTMTAWGVNGVDHPFYETMLLNFMNYSLRQAYSSDQYDAFIESCALADSVLMPKYVGYSNLMFSNSTDVNSFISWLDAIDTLNSFDGIYRDSSAAGFTVCVDFNIPPAWELSTYRTAIEGYTAGVIGKTVDTGLSALQAPLEIGYIYAYPGDTGITTANIFGLGSSVSITPAGTIGIWMGVSYVPQDYYTISCTPATKPYEISKDLYEVDRYFYNNGISATLVSNFQSTVNADYFKPEKTDYLKYTYSYQQLPPYTVLDSVTAPNLIARITDYNSDQVSYSQPFNPNVVTNLYLSDTTMTNRFFDTLTKIIYTVSDSNIVNPHHIFFDTNKVAIFPLGTNPLMAYRCSDGTYWYRYFGKGDTLYNVYVAMPPWIPQRDHPHYHIDTLGPPAGIVPGLGDSTTRFFVLNLVKDGTTDKIQARGMTTFVIGRNVELDNVLLGNPVTTYSALPNTDTFNNCERWLLNYAIREGIVDYHSYMDSVRRAVLAGFTAYVMSGVSEQLFLTCQTQEFDYTLYYYDRAGNLDATVPPAGVNPVSGAGVDAARVADAPPIPGVTVPSHAKTTTYNYNSINEVVQQNTPDAGNKIFYYDNAGRLLYTKDDYESWQGMCSYNLYDHQNRIIESGQADLICPYFVEYDSNVFYGTPTCYFAYPSDSLIGMYRFSPYSPVIKYINIISEDSAINYIHSVERFDVVMTVYDTAAEKLNTIPGLDSQQNLRHRISCIKYFKDYVPGLIKDTTYDYATHYSYDIDGNIKTLVQDCPALEYVDLGYGADSGSVNQRQQRYKRVDYDYDLISGKVDLLSYNRSFADQYYQRYSYDDDNRITRVETSSDGYIWHQDAAYTYYQHGPLARIDVGDQRVQGIDYAYTVQGWLKIMNADTMNTSMDMGQDANMTINATDAAAYSVDYFKNDYKPITAWQGSHVQDETRSLYNGNISRQTATIASFRKLNRQYVYDELNRIYSANYASVDPVSRALSGISDYHSNYSYDLDGNIQSLVRYGNDTGTGAKLMDSLKYHYGTGIGGYSLNQLKNLTDAAPDIYTNDIKYNLPTSMLAPSYEYDEIGRLSKDRIGIGGDVIHWNRFHNIDMIDTADDRMGGRELPRPDMWFDYDGLTNRVGKHYAGYFTGFTNWYDEYYTRDAQGNILAIYKSMQQTKEGWISLIIAAHAGALSLGVTSHAYVHDFITPYYGGVPAFRDAIMSYAMESTPFTTSYLSRPKSYFLNASNALYRDMVNADATYIMPLVNYEQTATDTIMGPALCQMTVQQPQVVTKMFGWLMADTVRAPQVLGLLCTVEADSMLSDMALGLGIDTTVSCDTMVMLLRSRISPQAIASAIVQNSANYPIKYASFMQMVSVDSTIYAGETFSNAGAGYIGAIKNAVAQYGDKSKVTHFFDSYSGASNMLSHIASDEELLDVCYSTDKDAFIYAFDSVFGDADLDTAVAMDPTFRPESFGWWFERLHVAPDGYYGDILNVVDFGLAEHDIYGSSRLGIKGYLPTQIGVQWDVLHSTADTVRLWQRKPWYSQQYQDVIKDSLSPYGNTFTDRLVTSHLSGQKQYELTDHLGDVLATVSDSRMPNDTTTLRPISFYNPVVQSAYDYFPFGMYMPGRYTSDTLEHCTTLSETILVPTYTTVWSGWSTGHGSFTLSGSATLLTTSSDVLISTLHGGDYAEYDLSYLPTGIEQVMDLEVDSANSSYYAMLVKDDTMLIGSYSISAGGSSSLPMSYSSESSHVTLRITSPSAGPWHIAVRGLYVVDTGYVPQLVLRSECNEGQYRYGFNGQMKTNEWAGLGNHTTALFWEYDTRVGRRDNLEPVVNPSFSPYISFNNNPVRFRDPSGADTTSGFNGGGGGTPHDPLTLNEVIVHATAMVKKVTQNTVITQIDNHVSCHQPAFPFMLNVPSQGNLLPGDIQNGGDWEYTTTGASEEWNKVTRARHIDNYTDITDIIGIAKKMRKGVATDKDDPIKPAKDMYDKISDYIENIGKAKKFCKKHGYYSDAGPGDNVNMHEFDDDAIGTNNVDKNPNDKSNKKQAKGDAKAAKKAEKKTQQILKSNENVDKN